MNGWISVPAILISSVLCGGAVMNAASAEDAVPISNESKGNRFSGNGSDLQRGNVPHGGTPMEAPTNGTNVLDAVGDTEIRGSKKATSDQDASKAGVGTGNSGEHQAGSRGTQGEQETGGKNALHGDTSASAKQNGTELSPIDTRITVVGAARSWRSSRDYNWKKRKVARPSGNLRYGRTSARSAESSVVRNAIGLPVTHPSVEPKGRFANEIPKSNVQPGSGGSETGGADLHRQGFIPLQAGGIKAQDFPINAALNHSIISGRDMIRQGSGAATIGGPVKRSAGLISGTNFQVRHP